MPIKSSPWASSYGSTHPQFSWLCSVCIHVYVASHVCGNSAVLCCPPTHLNHITLTMWCLGRQPPSILNLTQINLQTQTVQIHYLHKCWHISQGCQTIIHHVCHFIHYLPLLLKMFNKLLQTYLQCLNCTLIRLHSVLLTIDIGTQVRTLQLTLLPDIFPEVSLDETPYLNISTLTYSLMDCSYWLINSILLLPNMKIWTKSS